MVFCIDNRGYLVYIYVMKASRPDMGGVRLRIVKV